jgi:hypothetical protein
LSISPPSAIRIKVGITALRAVWKAFTRLSYAKSKGRGQGQKALKIFSTCP